MEITRRNVLLGATGGIIGGLPTITSQSVTSQSITSQPVVSPILPVQTKSSATLLPYGALRARDPNDVALWNKPHLDHCFVSIAPQHRVNSIAEAEDLFLSYAHDVFETTDPSGTQWAMANMTRSIMMTRAIRRQANYVALRSRRGFGNIVLMHPAMIAQIDRMDLVPPQYFQGVGEKHGRWERVGEVPKWNYRGSTVYCSDHLPMDEAFVLYRGHDYDAGAVALDYGGRLQLALQDDPSRYVTHIRFQQADLMSRL